jgi:hypothetical protein
LTVAQTLSSTFAVPPGSSSAPALASSFSIQRFTQPCFPP